MIGLTTHTSAPLMNTCLLFTDFDGPSNPSTKYEVFNPRVKIPAAYVYPKQRSDVEHFENVLSDVVSLIRRASTRQFRQLSKEEEFISRAVLQEAVKKAKLCIFDIFGRETKTSQEYCKDPEGSDLEWLDINLHFRDIEDAAIDELLDLIDKLNDDFEKKVDVDLALNINFYLDIQ